MHSGWTKMKTLSATDDSNKSAATADDRDVDYNVVEPVDTTDELMVDEERQLSSDQPVEYRVYKRRWFGLIQLVLLNIIISWDVSTCTLQLVAPGAGTDRVVMRIVALLYRRVHNFGPVFRR